MIKSLKSLIVSIVTILSVLHLTPAIADKPLNQDAIFQTSTINALLENVYYGDVTFKQLKQYGNFGLGTFNGLEGEMVVLDGKIYQVKADGQINNPQDQDQTPFAMVKKFKADRKIYICPPVNNLQDLQTYLDTFLKDKNLFYALKITGDFKYIKTRSVPKQEKPYKPITDVVKTQPIFEFNNIQGTLIGFRSPNYVEGITIPGYHLHFITADKKAGGHLLDIQCEKVIVEIDTTHTFLLHLPNSQEFLNASLNKNKSVEIQSVEQDKD